MRKLSILLLAVTLILTSCSSNDESTDANASIVGTWEMISFNSSGTGTTTIQMLPVTFNINANSFNEDYQLIFTENPNELTPQGTFGLTIEISALGQSMTETIEDGESLLPISETATSDWSLSGNQLTLMTNGETVILTVTELTETNLTFLVTIDEQVDVNGTVVDAQLSGEIDFVRM